MDLELLGRTILKRTHGMHLARFETHQRADLGHTALERARTECTWNGLGRTNVGGWDSLSSSAHAGTHRAGTEGDSQNRGQVTPRERFSGSNLWPL